MFLISGYLDFFPSALRLQFQQWKSLNFLAPLQLLTFYFFQLVTTFYEIYLLCLTQNNFVMLSISIKICFISCSQFRNLKRVFNLQEKPKVTKQTQDSTPRPPKKKTPHTHRGTSAQMHTHACTHKYTSTHAYTHLPKCLNTSLFIVSYIYGENWMVSLYILEKLDCWILFSLTIYLFPL